jgi:hypothetical protein
MDPYLETPAFWSDFHASFITYWRDALADQLPDAYEARIDERVNLVELRPEKIKRVEPDIAIARAGQSAPSNGGTGAIATLEPVTIPLIIEEEKRETYIEILHRPERSLVAVLELLSPSNKEEPGWGAYLAKRNAVLHHPVHLVELDLLRAGRRLPLEQPYPAGHYYALVARAEQRPDCQVYHWTVRQPLPIIPIPLRAPDLDIGIDLEQVFTTTYERGRYARALDYSKSPPYTFDEIDQAWVLEQARTQLKSSGL